MKILQIVLLFLFISSCSKPKVVLICGDHVCVNKAEADQFFQKNLTLEVKIIDNKIKKKINLVELNMSNNENGKRVVKVLPKENTNKNLKILSNEEINIIKNNIKKKDNNKKIVKKTITHNDSIKKKKINIKNKNIYTNTNLKDVNKKTFNNIDICIILDKCNIEEISKYLLEQEKSKNFPDITKRQ
jgi:hypothetical protein